MKIKTSHYILGGVLSDPENPPKEGVILDSFCRAYINYVWGVFLPEGIEVNNWKIKLSEKIGYGGRDTMILQNSCSKDLK